MRTTDKTPTKTQQSIAEKMTRLCVRRTKKRCFKRILKTLRLEN